jgi:hypothetical protein
MTTSQPKTNIASFDTIEDAVAFLGGWPRWVTPLTIPPLTPEERAATNRGLASGVFYGNGHRTQPTQKSTNLVG